MTFEQKKSLLCGYFDTCKQCPLSEYNNEDKTGCDVYCVLHSKRAKNIVEDYLNNIIKEYLTEKKVKSYEDGLNEAWELTNNICKLTINDLDKYFGVRLNEDVFYNNSYNEAKEKYSTYYNDTIKAGDVITLKENNSPCIVLKIDNDGLFYLNDNFELHKLKHHEYELFEKNGDNILNNIFELFKIIKGE